MFFFIWLIKPPKQPETGDTTIQYISGIKRKNSKQSLPQTI